MNLYLLSAITIVLSAQCALAQYQTAAYSAGQYQQQQQRKMAPTPQVYAQSAPAPAAYEQSSYEPQAESYKSAAYEERQPSAGYAKSAPGYAKSASGYAKSAAKYEEPYYPPMPFAWGYDINDGYGGAQYHKENGDEYGKRTGSYGYTDAYGIYRQVDYVADEHGFRATIKTNEPGTANESPADVELHAYEPPSNYYAGAPAKPAAQYQAAPEAAYAAGSKPAQYQAPSPQPAAYAPRPQAGQQRPSYGASKQQAYAAARAPAGAYESAQYPSSSVLVPVYQRAKSAGSASSASSARRAH